MGNLINRRGRLLRASALAVIVSLLCAASGPLWAAESGGSSLSLVLLAPRDQVIAGALQEILLAANLVLLALRIATLEDINETAQNMADTKHIYYAMDHRKLQDRTDISQSAYIDRFAPATPPSARFPGWRTAPAGNYAELYKTRNASWRAYAKSVAEGNGYAASDIMTAQATLQKLVSAVDNAYGNLQQIQAESQINRFLNGELAKLQVDLGRELDVKTAAAMNEQQTNADDVSAFHAAVAPWSAASVGASY
jgi:hypothetical protein